MNKLLYPQELASALGKSSRTYVFAMKKSGFEMPGGTATLEEAREWLRTRPNFSCTAYVKGEESVETEIPSIDVKFD